MIATPKTTATAITSGAETLEAFESVSKRRRPEIASETTPRTPMMPPVGSCVSAMRSADAEDQKHDPGRRDGQLRRAEEPDDERDEPGRAGKDQAWAEDLDERSR